jgi:thiosulfate reductase cytochrome b subunit
MADLGISPLRSSPAAVRGVTPRHGLVVRVAHWVNAIGTLALIVSGVAILFAHPRLYWGETGAVGGPSLIDLPMPFVFGHSGWGRYLHFLAAWVCVGTGLLYLMSGIATRHFAADLLPSRHDLSWRQLRATFSDHVQRRLSTPDALRSYNGLQRLAYSLIVFVVGPIVLLSGLAFSPMLAAVAPWLVGAFGGQQSARTIHFFAAAAVVVFVLVHIVMVATTGFRARMRSMIVGRSVSDVEAS